MPLLVKALCHLLWVIFLLSLEMLLEILGAALDVGLLAVKTALCLLTIAGVFFAVAPEAWLP